MKEIGKKINKSLQKDRFLFFREFRHLKRMDASERKQKKNQKRIVSLKRRLAASVEKREWRKNNRPELTYNQALPVTGRKDELIGIIKKNQVVIVSGETGSGKTTQLPKFCLAAGRGINGMIACTQPRRIAAVTVSNRIAEELGQEVGNAIGYKIRFRDKTADNTFIKVMTDGILLAEAQNDRFLNQYDTIIVDEAHERSLNIDFILGILRTLVKKRKDIKIIITSATIDTQKFSKAFNNAPVVEVTGRTYPVELIYKPVTENNSDKSFVERAVKAVEDINGYGPYGDILVFMPTEADIKETCEMLEGRQYLNASILPLFARLSAGEQKNIFLPAKGRKIVVATNVAETSITIPGIKYVVDTGLARIPQYTPRTRTTSLPVMSISKSSADQRKGRCGRIENGVCIRLFDEDDYHSRPLFTPPEIMRANLADVVLRMISLNLGDVFSFPFIDPPAAKSIQDGFNTLIELGAIAPSRQKKKQEKTKYNLTKKGRIMSQLPVDPKLSRMLIESEKLGCIEDITVIIAALAIRDPRERPSDKKQQADQAQAVFRDPTSDFVSILNIWKRYREETSKGKNLTKLKKFCKKHYLSFLRMREWRDIHEQLTETLKEHGMKNKTRIADTLSDAEKTDKGQTFGEHYQAIHKAILSGYLSGIATRKEKNIYNATRNREVMIFPGSGLFNKAGQWIVAAEMVETSRLFARNIANIDNRWLEELGQSNCKYSYSNPHWEKKKNAVIACEQVSLFGLIIVSERKVLFGRIDPLEASKIFIRSALVNGDISYAFAKKELSFLEHNLALLNTVRKIEDKVRRRDILIDDEALFDFYNQRLEAVYDIKTLVQSIKNKGGNGFLKMSREELFRYTPDSAELSRYPEKIEISGGQYKCNYRFQPGDDKDGISVKIPGNAAASVPCESLDWLVPGLVKEKIEAFLKALPKEYRKKLVPVTNTVELIINEMPELKSGKEGIRLPEKSLISALSHFIFKRFKINIPATAWATDQLPDHLKMRIEITEANGKTIAAGRSQSILKQDYSKTINQDQFRLLKTRWEINEIRKWDFGRLPDSIPLNDDNNKSGAVFPALVTEKDAIALRLFHSKNRADEAHLKGVKALYDNHFSSQLKSLKKDIVLPKDISNYTRYFGGEKAFAEKMYNRIVQDLFSVNIRSEEGFFMHAEKIAPEIYPSGLSLIKIVKGILVAYHQTRTIIFNYETGKKQRVSSELAEKLRGSLTKLVPESFLELYEHKRLVHLERYIKAIFLRAERAFVNPDKDKLKEKDITYFESLLSGYLKGLTPDSSIEKRHAIEDFFWLTEEYKVSVFAQELKTPFKISKKRLEKAGEAIQRLL